MKLYTIFRAVERAYSYAEIYDNDYFWSKYQRLKDGLIKRMEQLEYANELYESAYINEQIRAGNFTVRYYDKNNG